MNKMPDVPGIYAIVNANTRKAYVGSAANLRKRINIHLCQLRGGKHHSVKLQRSWDKHGESVFFFRILEAVGDVSTLIEREQWWIDKALLIDGEIYNISHTAGNSLGTKRTEETKEKLRAQRIGKRASDETRAKMRAAWVGRTISAAQREKMRLSQIGKVIPADARAKMSAAAKRRVASGRSVRDASGAFCKAEHSVRWSDEPSE